MLEFISNTSSSRRRLREYYYTHCGDEPVHFTNEFYVRSVCNSRDGGVKVTIADVDVKEYNNMISRENSMFIDHIDHLHLFLTREECGDLDLWPSYERKVFLCRGRVYRRSDNSSNPNKVDISFHPCKWLDHEKLFDELDNYMNKVLKYIEEDDTQLLSNALKKLKKSIKFGLSLDSKITKLDTSKITYPEFLEKFETYLDPRWSVT